MNDTNDMSYLFRELSAPTRKGALRERLKNIDYTLDEVLSQQNEPVPEHTPRFIKKGYQDEELSQQNETVPEIISYFVKEDYLEGLELGQRVIEGKLAWAVGKDIIGREFTKGEQQIIFDIICEYYCECCGDYLRLGYNSEEDSQLCYKCDTELDITYSVRGEEEYNRQRTTQEYSVEALKAKAKYIPKMGISSTVEGGELHNLLRNNKTNVPTGTNNN